jgi:hypothetical protein
MNKKLDFTIDPAIFDKLLKIQEKLPDEATGGRLDDRYDNPAGLALLGQKDDKIDTVVNLTMSGGCWDAPNINHKDFDKGFRKILESNRIVSGMALIRHPDWYDSDIAGFHREDAKIPSHFRAQIHAMKNTFSDITKTAWIVLHNDYFRIYRPSKDEQGRVTINEIKGEYLFGEEDFKHGLVKDKFETEKNRKEAAQKKRRLKEEAEKKIKEAEKAHAAKLKKKQDQVNQDLAEGKKSIISAGNGLSYIKQKDGKYILWQTSR